MTIRGSWPVSGWELSLIGRNGEPLYESWLLLANHGREREMPCRLASAAGHSIEIDQNQNQNQKRGGAQGPKQTPGSIRRPGSL